MADEMDHLRTILENLVTDLGQNVGQVQNQLDYFLRSIEPEVNQAVGINDVLSLNLIQDRLIGRASRTSLGFINKNKQIFVSVVMTFLRTLILLRP